MKMKPCVASLLAIFFATAAVAESPASAPNTMAAPGGSSMPAPAASQPAPAIVDQGGNLQYQTPSTSEGPATPAPSTTPGMSATQPTPATQQ